MKTFVLTDNRNLQVDCEMSFVTQEEILNTFEGLTRNIFQKVLQVDLGDFPRMTYDEAMTKYGSDKPDIRFDMEFVYLKEDFSRERFCRV